jgi:hypothetical protein
MVFVAVFHIGFTPLYFKFVTNVKDKRYVCARLGVGADKLRTGFICRLCQGLCLVRQ